MNQSFNHNILKKAVTQLPSYEPPPEVWSGIDDELNLQKGIKQLPNHQPADLVWQVIEANLTKSTSRTYSDSYRKGGTRQRFFWIKRLSIAASLLFLIGISWWGIRNIAPQNQLSYSQETIDVQLLIEDWEEDSEALAQIEAICQIKNYACMAIEFQALEQELKELNEAKLDLKQAIDAFGKDTQLIAKLSKVELERTTVLKKMIANIL